MGDQATMMRYILAALLLFISVEAKANVIPRGSTTASVAGCSFTGSTTSNSCLTPLDTTDFFVSTGSPNGTLTGQFGASICGAGGTATCFNIFQVNPPSGSPWVQVGSATKAIVCSSQTTPTAGTYFAYDLPLDGQDYWFQVYQPSVNGYYQTTMPCSSGPAGAFVNHTTSTTYYALQNLCAGAVSGDSLEGAAQGAGITAWQSDCDMLTPNVSLTLDSGTKIYNGTCEFGAGNEFCIKAANFTLTAAGAELSHDICDGNCTHIDILADAGTNPIIQGASGNPFTIDCQQAYGQPDVIGSIHGIESGRRVGLVTVSHVVLKNCGGGTAHSMYLGWGPNGAVPNDTTYCSAIDDLVIQDQIGASPAIKLDDTCGTSNQGTVTNLSVYCTIEGNPSSNCEDNQPFDSQCGGNQLISSSYFEMYGQPGSNDQWVFAKLMWGAMLHNGCQGTPAPTNNYRFDKDIFVFDGHANPGNGFGGKLSVVCGSAFDGNDCAANAASSTITTSSSSIPITGTGNVFLTVGTNVTKLEGNGGLPVTIQDTGTPGNTISAVTSFLAFVGSISSGTLTVASNLQGGTLFVGEQIGDFPGFIPNGVTITALGTGTGGLGTYILSDASLNVGSEDMWAGPYAPSTGKLEVNAYASTGSGTITASNLVGPSHTAACITNSQIIEDSDEAIPALWAGQGVFVDSGCTGVGADTNTYYLGQNGTTSAGRRGACTGNNWLAGSASRCAFPFVPAYITTETHSSLVAEATAAGCTGTGTLADPIRACP